MKDSGKTTRIAYIIEAGFEYFIALFVSGTMLGYILDTLGLSDAQQGILSTVSTFSCGAQLFALALIGRKRKRIVTVGHLINQLCFVLIYLLPIIDLSPTMRTSLLMTFLIIGHLINNAIQPAKITWLMGAVKNENRGVFTAVKEIISLGGGILVSLVFGRFADVYRDSNGMPTRPYYVVCAVALVIMMLIHTVTLIISTEKAENSETRIPVIKTLGRLVSNRDLIKVSLVGILWNVSYAFSGSFFVSYTRQELEFSFTVLAIVTTAASICRMAVSPLIGKIADKYSFATSMTLSFGVAALGFVAMIFATPQTRWLYILYSCLQAFAMAGINSGVINLIYDYVNPYDRAVALGIKNAIGGILAFLTALFSGYIMEKLQANGGFNLFGISVYVQQLQAFITLIGVSVLIVYMRVVIAPLHKYGSGEDLDIDD